MLKHSLEVEQYLMRIRLAAARTERREAARARREAGRASAREMQRLEADRAKRRKRRAARALRVLRCAWKNARKRCHTPSNKSYPRYGDLGVRVTFDSFKRFAAELGPRPRKEMSIDRINPFGCYAPGNIRWADKCQQAANHRTSPANRPYAQIWLTLLAEGLSPVEAASLCKPISWIEAWKGNWALTSLQSGAEEETESWAKAPAP